MSGRIICAHATRRSEERTSDRSRFALRSNGHAPGCSGRRGETAGRARECGRCPRCILSYHFADRQPWLCIDRSRQRSEEHTSELQSLMRISYAVFCLKKKKKKKHKINKYINKHKKN